MHHALCIFLVKHVPQCLSPRPNGTPLPPLPLPQASVSLSGTKGGGTHSHAGKGGPNSDDWRNSLGLCLFCEVYYLIHFILLRYTITAAAYVFSYTDSSSEKNQY
jgi:hypothetical protein